jgi:hypothetical protein
MAAIPGGLEVIKKITKHYVPLNGVCSVDLVKAGTGVIG